MENSLIDETSSNDSLLEKLDKLEKMVESYHAYCKQVLRDNGNLKKKVDELYDENNNIFDSLYNIEVKLIQNNQYSRRENVEFANIPENVSQKELEPLIIKILDSINLKIQSYDLVAVHRIGVIKYNLDPDIPNRPRNVIVRFISRKNSIRVMRNKGKLKSAGKKFNINNLFVTENLCFENKNIFNKCCKLKKSGVINNVWSFNGVVCIQINEDDDKMFEIKHFRQGNFEDFAILTPPSNSPRRK